MLGEWVANMAKSIFSFNREFVLMHNSIIFSRFGITFVVTKHKHKIQKIYDKIKIQSLARLASSQ